MGYACEYPVSKASTLNLKSLRPALKTEAEMEVNRRLFILGAFCCCLLSITLDTRRKSQEIWTVAPSRQQYRTIMKWVHFTEARQMGECSGERRTRDPQPVLPLTFHLALLGNTYSLSCKWCLHKQVYFP